MALEVIRVTHTIGGIPKHLFELGGLFFSIIVVIAVVGFGSYTLKKYVATPHVAKFGFSQGIGLL